MIKKILLIRNGNNIFNKGFTKTLRPFATKVDPAVLSSEFDHIANKLSKFVDEKDLKTYKSLSIGEKLKKFDTILYNLTEKLNAYKAQLLDSKDSLQVFEKNVFFDCKRLNFIFRSEDLKELDSSFTDLIQLLDEYFKKIGMFSIFWKGGNIVDDIKFRLNHQDLLEPRNSMYYATGRFNERKFLIFEKTIKKLESLNLIKSKVDNSEVEDSLANFDPAALDNLNPKLFKFDINHSEEEKENANLDLNLDMLKKDIDNLVWQTILLQSTLWGGCLFVTHLGIPWAITIPFTLTGFGLGFKRMQSKFETFKEKLYSYLSLRHQKIKSNLVLTYDKEFDRLLRKPLIRVLEIGESEISKEFNLNEKYIELLILLALFIKLWFKEPPPWIIVNFILLFGILFDIPTRSSKKFLFGLKRILTKSEFSLKKFVAIYHFSYFVFLFIFTTLVALEYMITSNLWYVARLSCSAACPTFNDNCLKITDPLLKNQTYLSEHPDCSLNRVTDWQKSMTTLGAISFPIVYLMLVNFFVIHSVATRVVTDINGGDLFASNLDKKLNSLSNSNEMSKRILRTHEDEQNHSGKNLSLKKN